MAKTKNEILAIMDDLIDQIDQLKELSMNDRIFLMLQQEKISEFIRRS